MPNTIKLDVLNKKLSMLSDSVGYWKVGKHVSPCHLRYKKWSGIINIVLVFEQTLKRDMFFNKKCRPTHLFITKQFNTIKNEIRTFENLTLTTVPGRKDLIRIHPYLPVNTEQKGWRKWIPYILGSDFGIAKYRVVMGRYESQFSRDLKIFWHSLPLRHYPK